MKAQVAAAQASRDKPLVSWGASSDRLLESTGLRPIL